MVHGVFNQGFFVVSFFLYILTVCIYVRNVIKLLLSWTALILRQPRGIMGPPSPLQTPVGLANKKRKKIA